jgi:ferritin
MIITILIDDDSLNSSTNLSKIFESIILSLNSLNEIKITNKDFLVCIFFQHFSYEETFTELFPGLNFNSCNNWNSNPNNFYCSYGHVLSVNDTQINTLIFYKESSTFIEVYKFFYCHVLNDIITLINTDAKEIGKTFLLVNWPNGKLYDHSSNKYHKSRILSNIFRICNNRNMVLIPDINYYPNDNNDIFGHINQYTLNYDKIGKNLYWYMICGYPIDHRFFFVNMNYRLYSIFKEYYQNCHININSNEYYHDFNLSIYLKDNMKNLIIQKIQQVRIQYSDLSSNLTDYFYDYILRRGSEYAYFFI